MEAEMSLDPQLWQVCAGNLVHMPAVNSKIFYFPQGHAEHFRNDVVLSGSPENSPFVLCKVSAVKFLADPETDDVYAKIGMIPLLNDGFDFGDDEVVGTEKKPNCFAKTLTQSDANNGGGFSVPRYCAETIFPRLDYAADPPVQTVVVKDVHGECWKFRHIYRGTPRRHLLTTGWSSFVNQKKLVAGDSIVFLRGDNGDLCVGIRRANRGIGGGHECSNWNSNCRSGRRRKVDCESVIEAAARAAKGEPLEVVYYPRGSTPEFCVKGSSVKAAMRVQWSSGMRFKMAFETEDSSRISWFMGTIDSVKDVDPIRWPNSPWRCLQVTWDEPDLLQNVKRVSPWLVELVSNVQGIHQTPLSPPRKRLRLPQCADFPIGSQFAIPSFSGNPLGPSVPICYLSDDTPAGIQGARHAQFGISLSNLHLSNRLQLGLFPSSLQQINPHSRISDGVMTGHTSSKENLSFSLTMGNSSENSEKSDHRKRHQFRLFGQPILTEQQISCSRSSEDTVSHVITRKYSSDGIPDIEKDSSDGSKCDPEHQNQLEESSSNMELLGQQDSRTTDFSLDSDQCKVFMESEDVGRTLDLSVISSYEELYQRLASMFVIERTEMLSHAIYRDGTGAVKQIGDESFSDFAKTAKRLIILTNSGSNKVGRTLILGMLKAEKGLDSSNKTGPLSIYA